MSADKQAGHSNGQALEEILERRIADFHAGRINCAESVLIIMADYYGWQNPAVPRIATAFGGGIAGMQYTCGAYTGGAMVLGMLMGREVGGDRAPCVAACKALYTFIVERGDAPDCRGIVGAQDFGDPDQQAIFRGAGGKHETVCEPLVAAVCRYLAANHPRP